MVKGSCLCGAVRFEVMSDSIPSSACHCGQCRRWSGHFWAAGWVPESEVRVEGEVSWFASSDTARRGFCGRCGSALFWKHNDEAEISFALGALDGPTGLSLDKHIFVADKGDYYDIADGLPQSEN
ncbi:MAG: GFA family protein [Pseudomonadota bacterium]